jgi:hypothetical protein
LAGWEQKSICGGKEAVPKQKMWENVMSTQCLFYIMIQQLIREKGNFGTWCPHGPCVQISDRVDRENIIHYIRVNTV